MPCTRHYDRSRERVRGKWQQRVLTALADYGGIRRRVETFPTDLVYLCSEVSLAGDSVSRGSPDKQAASPSLLWKSLPRAGGVGGRRERREEILN